MAKINYSKLYTLRSDGRYMGFWHDENGKRHAVYDRDPEKLHLKIKEKEAPNELPFSVIVDAWEEEHNQGIAYNTQQFYKPTIKQITGLWGDLAPRQITPQMVQSLINDMGKKGFAKRTVQARYDCLDMIFDYAILKGAVSENPCAAVRLPSTLTTKKRELPERSDVEAVKAGVDKDFGLFAYLIMYSGLRRGEALALQWGDIDMEKREIHVSKSLYWEYGYRPVIKQPKSKAGIRRVPLLAPLEKELRKQQDRKAKHYVFGGEQPMTQTLFRRSWDKYKEQTGVTLTPHQLRHEFATLCYDAGLQAKDTQEIIGHASITTTHDIYTHITESRKQASFQLLENYVENDKK
ncbi:MAG: site-specific integrase [Bacteroidales bacterium]|nr:site-specific integrase [Bacteroidales bacterium]